MATHLYTYDDPPAERDLRRALQVLESDGVIAYPNDYNWAFGCDAISAKALDKIHLLKPTHPKDRPFSLLCSSISMAAEYVHIDNAAYRILKRAWPGPYTVLLQATRTFPRQLKDKRRIVGIRIPSSQMVRTLVERLAHPLATTSVPDHPHFGYEVYETYGHAVDLVLDLGTELTGDDSTIVDLSDGEPTIVRRGAGDPALFEETSA
jgi:tRNA threonylcarbamoyl adenosine modification protein (Sua5/YciO/YrdC/YwlC family)